MPTGKPELSDKVSLAGKRVIFVLGPLELGGSERQALLLARYLKNKEQAEVQIWGTMGTPGRLTTVCAESNIAWRIVSFQWTENRARNLTNLAKFAWQLRSERPDIILPYWAPTNVACNLIWKLTGARLCVWNQRDLGLDRVRTKYEQRALRNASCFIANSEHVADYLVSQMGVEPHRISVVRNGIELPEREFDRETWRSRLNVDTDCFVTCMVANLHRNKDHATLLQAWRIVIDRLSAKDRSAVLVLAGRFDGTHDVLKALAFDLGLGESVRFAGQVSDISGLLAAMDLGVFSSRSEGSPNGVLECMAAGLPVIATDIAGVREALGDASRPFLTPVADVQAMADAISMMAAQADVRLRLGNANRQRALEYFGSSRMCEDTVAIIKNIAGPVDSPTKEREVRPERISESVNET